jgi:gas vesicle protein
MKILFGTLAGLVAGVAIGMLLAPVSGSETRSTIANGTKERWRRLWSKVDMDEDPWAEYNQRKAAASQNATA